MKQFVLTGGIGSGKSAAARRFSEQGIPIIDADAIGHSLLEPQGPAYDAVINHFGESIVVDGKIDRKRLAARVFSDDEALQKLNAITHPHIITMIAEKCTTLAGQNPPAIIVEAAILGEKGFIPASFDGLILVSAPVTLRMDRLCHYRHMDMEDARRRISAQTDPELKRPFAQWIIENDGDLDHLHRQVDAIAEVLHGLA